MTGFYLVLLAFALIVIEAHVPSFGVLGVAAIIALLAGGSLIVEQGGLFGIPLDWPVFLGIAVAMMVILVITSRLVVKSIKKKMITGTEAMIGADAHILEWDGIRGRVMIQGEPWHAITVHPHNFQEGDVVTVSAIDDLTLHIRSKD